MFYEWFLGITVKVVMVSLITMLRRNHFICERSLRGPENLNEIENGFF